MAIAIETTGRTPEQLSQSLDEITECLGRLFNPTFIITILNLGEIFHVSESKFAFSLYRNPFTRWQWE